MDVSASYRGDDRFMTIFKRKVDALAESFYSVKYGSSNITSNIPSNNLFVLLVSRCFLNNLQYWHFLYCFGLNLKKTSCRKSKYLQSTVEYLTEYSMIHI